MRKVQITIELPETVDSLDQLEAIKAGTVQAGDTFAYVERSTHGIRVADITRLYAFDKEDWAMMRRAVKVEALPENWRGYFQHRLEKRGQDST